MRGGAGKLIMALCLVGGWPSAALSESLSFHGRYQHWKVYRIKRADLDVCYAASSASRFGPRSPERERPILYITRYPKTSSTNTVELRFGGDVTAFGSLSAKLLARRKPPQDTFAFTVKKDVGFVAEPKAQKLLTEAMKKGRSLLVVSAPGQGEILEDRFSLFGYTKALAKLEQLCPGPEPIAPPPQPNAGQDTP